METNEKQEILALRQLGLSISEISKKINKSITEVCEVIYEQNIRDVEESRK